MTRLPGDPMIDDAMPARIDIRGVRLRALSWVFVSGILLLGLIEWLFGGHYWLLTMIIAIPHELLLFPGVLLLIGCLVLRAARPALAVGGVLLLITFGMCGFVVPNPFRATAATGPALTLVTYNIEGGSAGTPALRSTLEQCQADVICLQEANSWNLPDALFPGRRADWHKVHYGELAVLSRYPIVSHRDVDLHVADSDRGVLLCELDVSGHRVTVAVMHYSLLFMGLEVRFKAWIPDYIRTTSRVRREETDGLLAVCEKVQGPLIVCGDFNAPTRDPEIKRLDARFRDAFSTAGLGFGHTFESGLPVVRIDYVMTTADIDTRACRVLGQQTSDHLPVRAELTLP